MGNRLTSADTSDTWSYNLNNELQSYDAVSYDYDANGNMIQKTVGGVVTKFFYNTEDRLSEVRDGPDNLIASYYYDPFGRRLWKEVGGVRTYFQYADEGLVAELDAAGNVTKAYGYKPGSTWTTDPLFMKQGTDYYFYQNDHLGTPQKMTAVNGAVVWSAKYSSFGKATVDGSSSITNNLRFPGQYYDQETGLHYNYYRYYHPKAGRYLTIDPVGLDYYRILLVELNHLYAYSSLSPVSQSDPLGLFPLSPSCIASTISAKFECDDFSSASDDYRIFLRWCGDCWDWCVYERYKRPCDQKYEPEPVPTNEDCEWFEGFAAPSHSIMACKKSKKGKNLASKTWIHGGKCLSAIIKVAINCSVKP